LVTTQYTHFRHILGVHSFVDLTVTTYAQSALNVTCTVWVRLAAARLFEKRFDASLQMVGGCFHTSTFWIKSGCWW